MEKVISKDIVSSHRIVADNYLFRVGGTSMLLLRLQAEIRQQFGLQIPLSHMFVNRILGSMARLVDKRTGKESQSSAVVDWDTETDAPTQTQAALMTTISASEHHNPNAPPTVVVLSGATGFLGRGKTLNPRLAAAAEGKAQKTSS